MIQLTKKELDSLKVEAKNLFVDKRLTAKEISLRIKISEKSIGVWAKEYGWKAQRKIKEIKKLGIKNPGRVRKDLVINDLKKYMRKHAPLLYSQVLPVIDRFLFQNPDTF
jgi:uncharacterized protein YjcR